MNKRSRTRWNRVIGKSQNTPQLAVGMNGKRRFGGGRHILAFSLEDAPQQAAGFFTCAFILALIMTSSPGVTFGMQKGSNLASDFYTGNPSLHPDDAKVRDFERWLPTQYNPWN
jgi:hypothetical protein